MDFWPHIQTLQHPGSTENKLHALEQMYTGGHPSLIFHLISALYPAHNEAVRDTICDTIIHLFRKNVHPASLYRELNHCEISRSAIDFFEATFDQQRLTYLLIISSLNSNGYTREKAVRKLGEIVDAAALPFLIHRLADWVKPVRQAAESAVLAYRRPSMVKAFIIHLPLLEWLQKVGRVDLSQIRETLLLYIGRNRELVKRHFTRYPDKQRLLIARYLSTYYVDRSELLMYIADRSPLVRQVAIGHLALLEPADITMLLRDKVSRVRLSALRWLQKDPGFNMMPFVADIAGGVREFARYQLKEQGIDFTAFYLDQLQQGQLLRGSLAGLTEMNARQHAGVVAPFLHHENNLVVKAAFAALRKLDEEAAYQFALKNMDHPATGFRHAMLDFLAVRANKTILDIAREYYINGPADLKHSMIRLFARTGGWSVAPDLMLGSIDPLPSIRQRSMRALQQWRKKATTLYTNISVTDRERALTILRFATEVHDQHSYFPNNPLHGLDFYFR